MGAGLQDFGFFARNFREPAPTGPMTQGNLSVIGGVGAGLQDFGFFPSNCWRTRPYRPYESTKANRFHPSNKGHTPWPRRVLH